MTRKELMRLMPASGDDLPAATRIVEMGHPAVAPVMRDMIRWMRIAEAPVADAFTEFFGRLGEPAVGVIAEGLGVNNCWLRHRILTQILPMWPAELIRPLSSVLSMAATHPDAYDNDLRCVEVLTKHKLADPEWLKSWLTFKKERLAVRSELLNTVDAQLRRVQQAGGC